MSHRYTKGQRKARARADAESEEQATAERLQRERLRGEVHGSMPAVLMPEDEPVTTWSNIVRTDVPAFKEPR